MPSKRIFDASLYQFDQAQPSYWEATVGPPRLTGAPLTSDETCEVAIIGGGYTGMSAALHLARDFGIDVRVLEAGHIGWGASGRNGGFCTVGGTRVSLKRQIAKHGADQTRAYYQAQVAAVELVRQIARDEEIDIQAQGDGEYIVAESPAHYKHLEQENAIEQAVLDLDSRMITREAFREAGYDAPHQHGALMMRPSFGLHPLSYIHGLAEAAARRGAKLHPHSEVTEWQKNDGRHVLRTDGGTLTARNVIVACNGFMPEGLHKGFAGRALPLQSLIVVTRPLTGDERAAHGWKTECPAINSPNVYHYYRMLPDHRLLIGGRADCAGTPAGADRAADGIKETIGRMWPHWRGIEIDYQWRGLICFSSALRPSIGRLPDDPSVYFGFGYHGNGVNTATWTGRELAHWLAGSNSGATSPNHLPALVRA